MLSLVSPTPSLPLILEKGCPPKKKSSSEAKAKACFHAWGRNFYHLLGTRSIPRLEWWRAKSHKILYREIVLRCVKVWKLALHSKSIQRNDKVRALFIFSFCHLQIVMPECYPFNRYSQVLLWDSAKDVVLSPRQSCFYLKWNLSELSVTWRVDFLFGRVSVLKQHD